MQKSKLSSSEELDAALEEITFATGDNLDIFVNTINKYGKKKRVENSNPAEVVATKRKRSREALVEC